MSAVAGVVLVLYQGARWRRSSMSAGSWPAVAYQVTAMAWQASWNGMVRRTASGGSVAGLPGAEFLLGVLYRDLDSPSRGVSFDDLSEAGVCVGGDQG